MSDLELTFEPTKKPVIKGKQIVRHMQQGRPDDFQTPPEALLPLLPYLHKVASVLWEPAAGKRNLVCALLDVGFGVHSTDIKEGQDFLSYKPAFYYEAIVTNPPFSLKDAFLRHCYELGKPFALLMPLTALEGRQRQPLYRKHGLELILMDRRIHFETPSGKQGGAWFASAWFTHGLNIGQGLTFSEGER